MGEVIRLASMLIPLVWSASSAATFSPQSFPQPPIGGGVSLFLDAGRRASLVPGMPPLVSGNPVAWGSYDDAIDTTGWSVLDVHTSELHSGEDQSYGAGFLEGYLTRERMKQHQRNMWGVDFDGNPGSANITPGAANWSDTNMAWLRRRVREDGHHDPYWQQVGFLLEQLQGMTDGYNAARRDLKERLVDLPQVLMQSVVDTDMDNLLAQVVDTDMDDLLTAVVNHGKFVNSHYRHHSSHNVHRRHKRRHRGHCSALVQLAPGNADLWAGHVTWDTYRAMIRVVKYFDMPLPGVKARRIVFTSNPGSLYSGDDWYRTDAGLTILETTIENYNSTLWQKVQPESALTWVRTAVATRLATSGDEYTELQTRFQSGTCNNQWMVVDYKRFKPGEPLQDGLLWISETMPGYSRRADMTHMLRDQGSWPSYNIPYFSDIWEMGGYRAMQREFPENKDEYSFETDVRARMFARARDEKLVHDLPSFVALLRYNKWDDPLAKGNACNGLSARCDLNPMTNPDYDCFGAIDGKVATYRPDHSDISFVAVSGPSADQEVPFSWIGQNTSVDGCKDWQHVGQPTTFDFPWYKMPDRSPSGFAAPVELSVVADTASSRSPGAASAGMLLLVLVASVTYAGSTWCRWVGGAEHEEAADGYVKIDA